MVGVVSYAAARRTAEFGVRLALGARPADVSRLVLKQGALIALAGTAAGLLGALAVTRLLRGLLFGVRATDPLTLGAATLLLMAVALLASYRPARRAGRIDPVRALKAE